MSNKTRRPLAVTALILASFMAAMEATVVSTIMPTVVADLGGLPLYAWVFTAYMLAATVLVPVYGKLADVYGRKPLMLFGIALFLVGSMASGQARTMEQLIFFRVIQGLGAGAVQPTTITIVGDLFSFEERARMQGLFSAVWGIAGLIGPFLGGLIVKIASWRWVFYVNVPFGLASAAILVWSLHETIEKKTRTLDIAGALSLSAAIVALLLGSQGWLPWVLLPASALLVVAFVMIERRAKEPILPLDLFSNRVIAISAISSALAGASMFTMITFVPLFVQGVLGGSPTEAGGAIAPMVIAWPVASAIGGPILPKIGFRPIVRVGYLLLAVSAIALAVLLRPGASTFVARLVAIGFGAGLGLSQTAIIIAVQTSVSWERRGVATSTAMFARSIGSTIGVGVLGAFLVRSLLSRANVAPEVANKLLGPERRLLPPDVLSGLSGALQSSLTTTFWGICAIAVVGAVSAMWFPAIHVKGAKDEAHATVAIE